MNGHTGRGGRSSCDVAPAAEHGAAVTPARKAPEARAGRLPALAAERGKCGRPLAGCGPLRRMDVRKCARTCSSAGKTDKMGKPERKDAGCSWLWVGEGGRERGQGDHGAGRGSTDASHRHLPVAPCFSCPRISNHSHVGYGGTKGNSRGHPQRDREGTSSPVTGRHCLGTVKLTMGTARMGCGRRGPDFLTGCGSAALR